MDSKSHTFSTTDTAKVLGVSQDTVRRYIRQGLIKAGRFTEMQQYRIAEDEVRRIAQQFYGQDGINRVDRFLAAQD